jgi:hypothetical protein
MTDSAPPSLQDESYDSATTPQGRQPGTHLGCAPGAHADQAAVIAAWSTLSVAVRAAVLRRIDRAGARATKQECKAGDEKTQAECRQGKRTTKQEGRHDGGKEQPASTTVPAQELSGGRRPLGTSSRHEIPCGQII